MKLSKYQLAGISLLVIAVTSFLIYFFAFRARTVYYLTMKVDAATLARVGTNFRSLTFKATEVTSNGQKKTLLLPILNVTDNPANYPNLINLTATQTGILVNTQVFSEYWISKRHIDSLVSINRNGYFLLTPVRYSGDLIMYKIKPYNVVGEIPVGRVIDFGVANPCPPARAY
ncbi:MAG: hypothetical protein RL172_3272 [Bacteroidota bacterium]|jgi:hypothetical protein